MPIQIFYLLMLISEFGDKSKKRYSILVYMYTFVRVNFIYKDKTKKCHLEYLLMACFVFTLSCTNHFN